METQNSAVSECRLGVALMGDNSVGKSSLQTCILPPCDTYLGRYFSPIQTEISIDDQIVSLAVVICMQRVIYESTSGRSVRDIYQFIYDVYIFVFDKSCRESFEHIDYWISEVEDFRRDDVEFVLVGNKCDLESQVSSEEIMEKVKLYRMNYFETNGKSGEGVELMFEMAVRGVRERRLVGRGNV